MRGFGHAFFNLGDNVMKNMLEMIWEMYYSEFPPKPFVELEKATKRVNESENELSSTLTNEQQEMLIKCHDKWDKVVAVAEKQAFVNGVKFATNYLLEASGEK